MTGWSQAVRQIRENRTPAILVRVDSIRGSTPREVGARMIVTEQDLIGTIGGGNLEYQSIAIAREQLQSGNLNEHRRFPLGAGLGQCCGGVVNLVFERLGELSDWHAIAATEVLTPLYLFGAGHVGRAIVQAFNDLPFALHWIDTRDDIFPEPVRDGVETVTTDSPECEINEAPAGSFFLVMTHDHQLDLALTAEILKRDDFAYFGLIGSISKRRSFERRLTQRGYSQVDLKRMTCPIGIDGIAGKQPAHIAISVVAQILCRYDALLGLPETQHEQQNTTDMIGGVA